MRAAGTKQRIGFRVIDDPDPQAEAWLGDTVHVYRGALGQLRSEAELAALLGHEIGHVIAGHIEGHHGTSRDARDDEIQADEIAVRLTARAGYDPAAVELMLRAIGARDPIACDDAYLDHPCMAERVARVHALVAGQPAGEVGAERFRAAMSRLVSGADDPLRASLSGDTVVFAEARLAIHVPGGHPQVAAGRGLFELEHDVSVMVAPISVAFGALMKQGRPINDSAFYVGKDSALWIMVIAGGTEGSRLAASSRVRCAPHAPPSSQRSARRSTTSAPARCGRRRTDFATARSSCDR